MSGVATAVVAGAVVGAAATSYSADKSASATRDAASQQSAANLRATEMQLEFLRENREDIYQAVKEGKVDINRGFDLAMEQLEPYQDVGQRELNTARNLLSDPGSIMDRPSVQFQKEQGTDALQAAFSRTAGGGLSGRAVEAAQEFGQNLASTSLDAELDRLFPFINIGRETAAQIGDLEVNRGRSLANLKVGGAAKVANATGEAVPSIAAGVREQGNIGANAAIQQANISNNATQNYANITTGLVNSLATQNWGSGASQNAASQTTTPAPAGVYTTIGG